MPSQPLPLLKYNLRLPSTVCLYKNRVAVLFVLYQRLAALQIPSHSHSLTAGAIKGESAMQIQAAGTNWYKIGTTAVDATQAAGGGQGHTHTAGMPTNISVYMWKRTA